MPITPVVTVATPADDLNGRIVAHAEYGEHIALTCIHHPELRWTTKNICAIGCRSIFYVSRPLPECDCPQSDLYVVMPGGAQ